VSQSPSGKGRYLDSWKEIAAYLNRNVRTCWLWERELGLPVHRLDGSPKARVFAYTAELDAWRDAKGHLPANGETPSAASASPSGPAPSPNVIVRRSTRSWLAVALVAGPVLAVVATALIARRDHPAPTQGVRRFALPLEPGYWLDGGRRPWECELPCQTGMAISRDGRFVVYCAIEADPGPKAMPRLFLRRMDEIEATPIAGTDGAMAPFLSWDGQWVGFHNNGWVRKVPVAGGVPTALCKTTRWFYGGSWGPDGSVVFAGGAAVGLSMVSGTGGEPEALTKPDPKLDEWSHRLPSWLPDGKGVLFTMMRHGLDRRPATCLLDMGTCNWRILLEDAADARYVSTGHLVFLRQGSLMAVPFELSKHAVVGQAFPVMKDVLQGLSSSWWYHTAAGQYAVSENGTLVYASGGIMPRQKARLIWVDQEGRDEPVTAQVSTYHHPRLSPDGRRLAYVAEDRLWVQDLESGRGTTLTDDGIASYPVWSPDGKRILFAWHKTLADNLYWIAADGGGPKERLTKSPRDQVPGSFSPDGGTIVLSEIDLTEGSDVLALDVRSRQAKPLLDSKITWELYPEISPDGRWIAYQSHESGPDQIYVHPFPGPGPKFTISKEGGAMPLWSRDGRRLYWLWESRMWVSEVRTVGGFEVGTPRVLFMGPFLDWGSEGRSYDLSLDGRRFLTIKPEPMTPTPVTGLVVVENWFEEFKRLGAAGKK
jgi:eukaryotic-like serine/threonine-protein kinase